VFKAVLASHVACSTKTIVMTFGAAPQHSTDSFCVMPINKSASITNIETKFTTSWSSVPDPEIIHAVCPTTAILAPIPTVPLDSHRSTATLVHIYYCSNVALPSILILPTPVRTTDNSEANTNFHALVKS